MVFAPAGRDAQLAVALLGEAGIAACICSDLQALLDMLGPRTTFLIVAEEAMRSVDLRALGEWVETQPAWSDLPTIILTQRGGGPETNPAAKRLSNLFGNVSFLERPFHPTTFASLARTTLKARNRQYEARDRLEELDESRERLATALSAGKFGAWEYELLTDVLTASDLCKANFGRKPGDSFSYDDLRASIHADDRHRMQAAVRYSIESGEDYSIEYRVIWPNGGLHWVQVNARVVSDASGAPLRMVGVSAEITERKTAEENLLKLNETLEMRVRERTSELEKALAKVMAEVAQREHVESQLLQAQKMEMIGQLTGGVAHDFNNLLMAVLGNLDLLRKHLIDDPRAQKLIDGALQGANRGAALTQRLLAFARRQSLEVRPADLSNLVEGMKDLLAKSLGPSIDLRLVLPDGPSLALADTNQVELALLNLVVNGRDAMPDGGVMTIEVDEATERVASDLNPGRYVRLTVTDTGTGMDDETLQKAIEPFFSTKELGKGTGLGLSMIHGLAVQLHGALRLSSTPGVGTRAEFYVPVTTLEVEVAVAPEAPVSAEMTSRAKILVVDDDFLISMSTTGMLEDLGHEVVEANSGPTALEALKRDGPVDLVITDFAMPGMTGVQLAKKLREVAPGLPILLATGYAEIPEGTDLQLARIGKPYSQSQLAREIARLLPAKSSQGGAAPT